MSALPTPPYYAVIFTSQRTPEDQGYGDMADRMVALAAEQPGYLGVESARGEDGFLRELEDDVPRQIAVVVHEV